jgi:hypothetical protein
LLEPGIPENDWITPCDYRIVTVSAVLLHESLHGRANLGHAQHYAIWSSVIDFMDSLLKNFEKCFPDCSAREAEDVKKRIQKEKQINLDRLEAWRRDNKDRDSE